MPVANQLMEAVFEISILCNGALYVNSSICSKIDQAMSYAYPGGIRMNIFVHKEVCAFF